MRNKNLIKNGGRKLSDPQFLKFLQNIYFNQK